MNIKDKILVHHRAINTIQSFETFLEKTNKYSNLKQAAEGDLCWTTIDGEPLIYIHHPDLLGKSLEDHQVKKLYKHNKLLTLEKIFQINSQCNFVLELKNGTGNQTKALKKIIEIINKYAAKNILIDAFNLQQLNDLKTLDKTIKTSLHTKFLFNSYVLETTYQSPFINIHNCSNIPNIDYITLSFASSHINLLNLDIDNALKNFYSCNKKINFGAIKTVKMLDKASKSNVNYLYMRSNKVLNYLDLN